MPQNDPIAILLKPLKDIGDALEIDIGDLLKDFREDLIRLNQENVDFSRAAMVLEQAGKIYGKKVDDLYTVVQETWRSWIASQQLFQEKETKRKASKKRDVKKLSFEDLDEMIENEELENVNLEDDLEIEKRTTERKNQALLANSVAAYETTNEDRKYKLTNCELVEEGTLLLDDQDRNLLNREGNVLEQTVLGGLHMTTENINYLNDSMNASLNESFQQPEDNEDAMVDELHRTTDENHRMTDENHRMMDEEPPCIDEEDEVDAEFEKLQDIWRGLDPHEQNHDSYKPKPYQRKESFVIPKQPVIDDETRNHNFELTDENSENVNYYHINQMNDIFPMPFSKFNDPISFLKIYHNEFEYIYQEKKKSDRVSLKKTQEPDDEDEEAEDNEVDESVGKRIHLNDSVPEIQDFNETRESTIEEIATLMNQSMNNEQVPQPEQPKEEDIDIDPISDDENNDKPQGENLDDMLQSYEVLCRQYMEEYINETQRNIDNDIIAKKVSSWAKHIKPILHKEASRPEFDIQRTSEEILEDLPIKKTQRFSAILKGKERFEIGRILLSVLQLANHRNIAIKQLDTQDFHIKLLSKQMKSIDARFERIQA